MRMKPPRQWTEGFCVSAAKIEDQHTSLVEALRRHIARLEHNSPQFETRPARGAPWTTGVPVIDQHLGLGGLARTGLHDVSPKAYGDMPSAMGFALALALRRLADPSEPRPLLWCRLAREEREYGRLYGHGLETLGLARQRFVTVTLKQPVALLWTMEEALKSGAFSLVIADADARHASLTATRRLSLAAHAGKSAGLLVFAKPRPGATVSHTRWTATAGTSRGPPYDSAAPGDPVWRVELTRARGGRPGAWDLEWQHAPHRFNLVPGFRRGTLHPWADETGEIRGPETPALRAG